MNFSFCRRNVAAILALTFFLTACGSAPPAAQTVAAAKLERKIGPSDLDAREIDDAAKYLAGIEGRPESAYHDLEALPAWQTYKANFNETWAKVQETQFKPVAEFEKRALKKEGASKFLFYPFSGPDVLYMTSFFPGRDVYVMAAQEGIGHLPAKGEYTAQSAPAHLNAWTIAMNSIFRRSFFVTSEMSKQLHGDSDGVLPIITLLLTRAGYTVDAVQVGNMAKDGAWERLPADSKLRPRGVRVEFHMGGADSDAPEQTLYYFSTDLAKGFTDASPLALFLDSTSAKIGTKPETYIKSASFLLHLVEFTPLRDYILRNSTRIVQDDTGVPFQLLVDKGWTVRLFGEYSHPDKPFIRRVQPAMEAAFADAGKVEPLGFSIGYGYHRRPSSLLVATPK